MILYKLYAFVGVCEWSPYVCCQYTNYVFYANTVGTFFDVTINLWPHHTQRHIALLVTDIQVNTVTHATLTGPRFSKPFLVATWWATSFPGSPWSLTRNELVNTSPYTCWFAKNTASTSQQSKLQFLHVDEELFPERMSHVTTMASFVQKPNSLLLAVAADSSPKRRPPLDINPLPTLPQNITARQWRQATTSHGIDFQDAGGGGGKSSMASDCVVSQMSARRG